MTYSHYSELFLGVGATFTRPPDIGSTDTQQWLSSLDVARWSAHGPHPRVLSTSMVRYTWSGVTKDANGDGGKLDAARAYAEAHASYTLPPFIFILMDDDLSQVSYYAWAGDTERQHRFVDRYDYRVSWVEVIRSVA